MLDILKNLLRPLAQAKSQRRKKALLSGFFSGGLILNPDGSVEREVPLFLNMVPTAAINDILNVYFNAGTVKLSWFLGLVNNAGFTGFAAGDTMASHAGWAEATAFSGSRPQWVPGSPSGGSITNPSAATFTMTGSVTLQGAFLVSDATVSGTAGILWATGSFGSTQVLTNGQTFSLNYTCPGTAT